MFDFSYTAVSQVTYCLCLIFHPVSIWSLALFLSLGAKLSPGGTWVYESMLATAAEDCGRVAMVTQLEQSHK